MGFEACFRFLRMSFASICKAGQVSDHLLRWGLGREDQPAGTGECRYEHAMCSLGLSNKMVGKCQCELHPGLSIYLYNII